jgi:CRP-like cAMP-binding protein
LPSDRSLLEPNLEPVRLKFGQQLDRANRRIRDIYFIEGGLASVVAAGDGERRQAQICVIGREGMTGIAVLLGMERSRTDTFMQVEGHGRCISADELRAALERSGSLASALLRYVHVYIVQAEQAALANALGTIEERLARWLLMAHDRLEGNDLRLTHEFLAVTLGVRRAGVTTAINELEDAGLISAVRRCITIRDREGLEEAAAGLYDVAEAERARLSAV